MLRSCIGGRTSCQLPLLHWYIPATGYEESVPPSTTVPCCAFGNRVLGFIWLHTIEEQGAKLLLLLLLLLSNVKQVAPHMVAVLLLAEPLRRARNFHSPPPCCHTRHPSSGPPEAPPLSNVIFCEILQKSCLPITCSLLPVSGPRIVK